MPMQKSIADELYSDIQRPKPEFGQTSSTNVEQSHSLDGGDEEWCEDESSWNGSDIKSDLSSDLDREWQRRKNQFNAIGYRDGLIAGKEASAQIGFNVGFKESVIFGYNWGLVRGVTGALDCVPVELRERVIESQETSTKFHDLYESVDKLSTEDALKLFADDLSKRRITGGDEESILPGEENKLEGSVLHSYYGQLQSLIVESPAIDLQLWDKTIHVSSTN
nr:uncharacterized protein LOC122583035 isoform X2 [Erigeron canadensis]XP_043611409.1 uncharacterized protein LOC122583035 isoform X2 [Erigeron canadensis]XP_043611410.1 uncharacterized protein LOC122583035 isoform X2 [Erigeron canadensis]XP_043611411.1 uncharacterized protein LOC122583035 isoform X2 [Erigeron canadensis]XP_043611412.1 uncharacterized protein LOC122583035 isoform X2 [Erigeron canadensis]